MESAAYYSIVINLTAFTAILWDKHLAETGSWRVQESTLLALAFFGGTLGAYTAMRMVRHKTRKRSFQREFAGIVAVQSVAAALFFTETGRDLIAALA